MFGSLRSVGKTSREWTFLLAAVWAYDSKASISMSEEFLQVDGRGLARISWTLGEDVESAAHQVDWWSKPAVPFWGR